MLKANYDEMHQAAREITSACDDYKANVDALFRIVDNLGKNWQGADNMAYSTKVMGYKEDLKSLGDTVNEYAGFLKISANALSEAQDDVTGQAGRL